MCEALQELCNSLVFTALPHALQRLTVQILRHRSLSHPKPYWETIHANLAVVWRMHNRAAIRLARGKLGR